MQTNHMVKQQIRAHLRMKMGEVKRNNRNLLGMMDVLMGVYIL